MTLTGILMFLLSFFSVSLHCQTKNQYPSDMCKNLRWINNRYVGKQILVKCGHCKACLQEKANARALRIKNEYNSNTIPLFVTLTYDRFSCPYVKHEDIINHVTELPVYRDCVVRRDPVTHVSKRKYKPHVITTDYLPNYDFNLNWLPYLKKSSGGKVGVCLFSDVQDFNKRLRQNLKRVYKYDGKYKVYNTFEYGERTFRPHIHLLIFVEKGAFQVFKSAIVESWPFARRSRTSANIEIARDAASYVASYVNSGGKLPLFIARNFPPKHSFSQGLGMACDSFQLDSLLENVRRCNMSYNLRTSTDGVPTTVNLPVPKYVINRFFPLFKGYSRLAPGEVFDLLQSVARCSDIYEQISKIEHNRRRIDYHHFEYAYNTCTSMIHYTLEDMFSIATRLHNSFIRYNRISGRSAYDYALDFTDVWNCYKNTIYKRFALDDEPLEYKYDNQLADLMTPRRIQHDKDLCDLYDKKCKTKEIVNIVYSHAWDDV